MGKENAPLIAGLLPHPKKPVVNYSEAALENRRVIAEDFCMKDTKSDV